MGQILKKWVWILLAPSLLFATPVYRAVPIDTELPGALSCVPQAVNDAGELSGYARIKQFGRIRHHPVWWSGEQEPLVLAKGYADSVRPCILGPDGTVLCRLKKNRSSNWLLWNPSGDYDDLELPLGVEGRPQHIDEAGVVSGTYNERRDWHPTGLLYYGELGEAELYPIRSILRRKRLLGPIHSILHVGGPHCVINFSHSHSLDEDFLIWDMHENTLTLGPQSPYPRVALYTNPDGAVAGAEFRDDYDSLTRHFFWSAEEGMRYLQEDVPDEEPDNPFLLVSGMSHNGTVIGHHQKDIYSPSTAFLWTVEDGMVDLAELIPSLDPQRFEVERARSISPSGLILVDIYDRRTQVSKSFILIPD
jgi:hypothetical protein